MFTSVCMNSESPMAFTKHVCGRHGNLGLNVLPADSMRGLIRDKSDVFLNINGISGLFTDLFFSLSVLTLVNTAVYVSCQGYLFVN